MLFLFFNDTATTEIYTLSLHDALPISHDDGDVFDRHHQHHRPEDEAQDAVDMLGIGGERMVAGEGFAKGVDGAGADVAGDRKSTRLNSSHANISYAVFCLKKKIIVTQI